MTTPRNDIPQNQQWLIERRQKLIQESSNTETSIDRQVSEAALFATLTGEMEKLDERWKLMSKYSPTELEREISKVSIKRDRIIKNLNGQSKIENHDIDLALEKNLTENEKELLNINIMMENFSSRLINDPLYINMKSNLANNNKDFNLLFFKMITPVRLEEKGGAQNITEFSGNYLRNELVVKFNAFTIIKNIPLAFYIQCGTRTLLVSYDGNNKWQLVDAEKLPSQTLNLLDLVREIFLIFKDPNYLPLTTKIYTCGIDAKIAAPLIDKIKAKNEWKIIHAVYSKKSKLVNLNNGNYSWLAAAIVAGEIATVKQLLEQGAEVNAEITYNNEKGTYLHLAAQLGETAIAQLLLDHGANADSLTSTSKNTPFHLAVQYGHFDTSKLLLIYTSNINAFHSEKLTPLLSAIRHNNLDLVKLLLDNNANIDLLQSKRDLPPIFFAAALGYVNIVKEFIKRGANLHFKDEDSELLINSVAQNGYKEIIEILLKNGFTLKPPTSQKNSAIYLAAKNGHSDIVKLLIELGSDIDAINSTDELTPLAVAAKFGRYDVVTELLKHSIKININHRDQGGRTPLYHAAEFGHTSIVELLLKHGADPTLEQIVDYKKPDIYMKTPLLVAIKNGHRDVVTILFETITQKFPQSADYRNHMKGIIFRTAAWWGYLALVKYFLSKNIDINSYREIEGTALSCAVQMNHLDVVKYLLQEKADAKLVGSNKLPPLITAIENENIEIIKAILETYPDAIEQVTNQNLSLLKLTPLSFAVKEGKKEIVEMIIENKNKISDDNLNTALFLATLNENLQIVVLLLSAGANPFYNCLEARATLENVIQKKYRGQVSSRMQTLLRRNQTDENSSIIRINAAEIADSLLQKNISYLFKNRLKQIVLSCLRDQNAGPKNFVVNNLDANGFTLNQIVNTSEGEYTFFQLLLLAHQFNQAKQLLKQHSDEAIDINCKREFSIVYNKIAFQIKNINLPVYLALNEQFELLAELIKRLPEDKFTIDLDEKPLYSLVENSSQETLDLPSLNELLIKHKQVIILRMIFEKTTDHKQKQQVLLSLIEIDGNSDWHKEITKKIKYFANFSDKNIDDTLSVVQTYLRDFNTFLSSCENKNLFLYIAEVVITFVNMNLNKPINYSSYPITLLYTFCLLPSENRQKRIQWLLDSYEFDYLFDKTSRTHFQAALGNAPTANLLNSEENKDCMGFSPVHYAIIFSPFELPALAYNIKYGNSSFLSVLLEENIDYLEKLIKYNTEDIITLDHQIQLSRRSRKIVTLACYLVSNNRFDLINKVIDKLLNKTTPEPINISLNEIIDITFDGKLLRVFLANSFQSSNATTLFEKLIIENQFDLLKKILQHDNKQKIHFYESENQNFKIFNVMLTLLEKRQIAIFEETINRDNIIQKKYDLYLRVAMGDKNYYVSFKSNDICRLFENGNDYLNDLFIHKRNKQLNKGDICNLTLIKKGYKLKNSITFDELISILETPKDNLATSTTIINKAITNNQAVNQEIVPSDPRSELESKLKNIFDKYKNANCNNDIFTLTIDNKNNYTIEFKGQSETIRSILQTIKPFLGNIKTLPLKQLPRSESSFSIMSKVTGLNSLFSNKKLLDKLNSYKPEDKNVEDKNKNHENKSNENQNTFNNAPKNVRVTLFSETEINNWKASLEKLFCHAEGIKINWHDDEQQFKIDLPPENTPLTIRHPKLIKKQFDYLKIPDSVFEYISSRIHTYKIDDTSIAIAGFYPKLRLIRIKPNYSTTEWADTIYQDVIYHLEKEGIKISLTQEAVVAQPLLNPHPSQTPDQASKSSETPSTDINNISNEIKNFFKIIMEYSIYNKQDFIFLNELNKIKENKFEWIFNRKGVACLGKIPSIDFFNLLSEAIQLLLEPNQSGKKWLGVHLLKNNTEIKLVINMKIASLNYLLSLDKDKVKQFFADQTNILTKTNESGLIQQKQAQITLHKIEETKETLIEPTPNKPISFKFDDEKTFFNFENHLQQLEKISNNSKNDMYFYAYLLHLLFICLHLDKACLNEEYKEMFINLRNIIRHAYSNLEWTELLKEINPLNKNLLTAVDKAKKPGALLFKVKTPILTLDVEAAEILKKITKPYENKLINKELGKGPAERQENINQAKVYEHLLSEIKTIDADEKIKRAAIVMIYSLIGETNKNNISAATLYKKIGHPKYLGFDFNDFIGQLYSTILYEINDKKVTRKG